MQFGKTLIIKIWCHSYGMNQHDIETKKFYNNFTHVYGIDFDGVGAQIKNIRKQL